MATYTNSGVTFTIGYTEPAVLQNGAPLTNLIGTAIYWKLGAGAETKVSVPASKFQGGGIISRDITVPVLPGTTATLAVAATAALAVAATAANSYGESARASASQVVDRTGEVAPGAPTALTIS